MMGRMRCDEALGMSILDRHYYFIIVGFVGNMRERHF